MDTASKTREAVRASLRELKSSMKFTTVEAIDDAIEKLEHRVQHSSLSLNEEKKVLDDIRKLKASRAAVGEYREKLEALAQDDTSRSELQAGIKALDEELNKVKSKEQGLRQELDAQREKDQESTSDVPALVQEREECRELCKQAYEKIKDLRAEHDTLWQEFKAQEKIWREQQLEERNARRQQMAEERAARDAERAARQAEMAPEPFDKEITMCDQLTAYLARFVVTDNAPADEQSKSTDVNGAIDGMKVLQRAGEDDLAWMVGTGGKRAKSKGKKPADKPAAPEKLVHSLDMLDAFATLKLSVPTTAAAVPNVLITVAAKKDDYLAKRKEVKEKGAEEPATAAAASNGDAAEPEADAPDAAAESKKKGGKKATPAPPKLDDVASWPTVGAAPVANGNGTSAAIPEEVEEGELPAEEEAAPAPEPEPTKARPADGVAVELKVADGKGVSLAITASDG